MTQRDPEAECAANDLALPQTSHGSRRRLGLISLSDPGALPSRDLGFEPSDSTRSKPDRPWKGASRHQLVNRRTGEPSGAFDIDAPENIVDHLAPLSGEFQPERCGASRGGESCEIAADTEALVYNLSFKAVVVVGGPQDSLFLRLPDEVSKLRGAELFRARCIDRG